MISDVNAIQNVGMTLKNLHFHLEIGRERDSTSIDRFMCVRQLRTNRDASITKYRYKVLRGEVAERGGDLLRQICAAREVRIIRGAVSPDHIHMLVSHPRSWRRRGSCSF
jgi:Transposase IS200 like